MHAANPRLLASARLIAIFDLAKELGFDIVNLKELGPEGWVHIRPKDSYWQDGFLFPKVYTEAESIVQTCCLKTHAYGGHLDKLQKEQSVFKGKRTDSLERK